jgi:hypothetical protein
MGAGGVLFDSPPESTIEKMSNAFDFVIQTQFPKRSANFVELLFS